VSVTEKDVHKVLRRHPWLPYDYARRIAEDLKRSTHSTPKGRRTYNREYMRLRRAEKTGEISDVAGVISGKYLKKKRRIEE
jgi:hypothetical protein